MAIDLATGFNIGSKDAIDERQVLTLEQMKNLDESIYPDKYFAICKDNGKLYLYDASNAINNTTGKFRLLEGNAVGGDTLVEGAKYYTLEEVDLSYHFLLAKIDFGDKTSFSGKMTFMCNHTAGNSSTVPVYTEKKEIFLNYKKGREFNFVMHAFPIVNGGSINEILNPFFTYYHFRGVLTKNNEFYLFLTGMLNRDNTIHNFYIEYIGDGTVEKTFEFDDASTNPYNSYGWSGSKWYVKEGIMDNDLMQPSYIEVPSVKQVLLKSSGPIVYSKLRDLNYTNNNVTLSSVMKNLYPSQALFCDVTEFLNYQTMFPYEEEADAESRVYILCVENYTNYYLKWERKDGTKQAISYVTDDDVEQVTWNMIVGGNGSAEGTAKEEDSYIPNVYDRNANGDMPVVGFDRLANYIAVRTNKVLVSTTETEATYDEDYVGGYVFNGANDILVKDKEMFNKIKVLVHIPGVLRIGIVNEKIYEANPRYSTCLVKWLVADFVAFTGMKEYDIDDTVLEEGQSIFLECRTGVSSWYLNTGEATQVGAATYPANSCTTGLNVADKLDTTTNNALFKSQKVNSSSCLTSFGNNMYSIGGNIRGNFRERAYNSGALSSKKADENFEYFGGLNIGLYRRTKYSDTRVCKCVENAMNNSWVGDNTVTKIYAPYGQERLVGKSVYAFKLDVRTPGNLTIYHLKGKSLDTVQVIDKYTHYVRAKGLQTIHLPFDIKINSTDEYIGFGGFHCKSTSDNIVKHSCQWCYLDTSQATWMTTIDNNSKKFYSIGLSNTDYPEKFTSFETNSNYVNIELICRGEKRSPLEDKYISFTGDSITTFAGFCTTKVGYPEGNPAGDNAVYYPASGKVINNVDATWWGILARDNRMKILRNDAWSGSRVSSSEGSTDTRCLCGDKRRYYLRNGYNFATNSTYPFGRPEIVVSMIGTNDLSGNVELGSEMFRGVTGAEEEYKTILSAFSLFCRRIHDQEGNGGAKIVHFLIPRGSDYGYANAKGVTIADLSLHFERIAKAWGQYFIPLSYFNGIKPNTPKRWSCPTGSMFKNTSGVEFPSADGLHPNAMGMEVIADGVHRFLCSIM